MTEQELQQYLLSKYPKENEECEWKEFKNMKNDFNGKEKDDVISYVSALSNMEGGHWLSVLLTILWRLSVLTHTTTTDKKQNSE